MSRSLQVEKLWAWEGQGWEKSDCPESAEPSGWSCAGELSAFFGAQQGTEQESLVYIAQLKSYDRDSASNASFVPLAPLSPRVYP